jgi:hypothetical protein
MAPQSTTTLSERLVAAEAAIRTTPPAEILALTEGRLANRAGAAGQYFTTLDTAAGMLRDYAGYSLFPLLRMFGQRHLESETFQHAFRELSTSYASFLGYCGLTKLAEFTTQLGRELGEPRGHDELNASLSAYSCYVNRLNAWMHHYFPWGLADRFAYPDDGHTPTPPPALAETVGRPEGRTIELSWHPLDITVHATLADNLNPDLCDDLAEALPFTVLQDHSVVSGESIFAWTPLVTTTTAAVRERVCDAPAGRLRYQQATGQKLVVAYGRTTETGLAPVLGQVELTDLAALHNVGEAVMRSTFRTKELIWLTVSLCQ